ncbi:MAG: aminoglycoside phosphotransferase [Streptomycetaceae bacterium]|nr:aminoglycoside phosphotransferase [Streptomycetaceae bacterium]
MAVAHTPWQQLPAEVHIAVEKRLGSAYTVQTSDAGANNGTNATLTLTDSTRLFIKGQFGRAPREFLDPVADPQDGSDWWGADWGPVDQLNEEARINPYLPAASPRVLWREEVADWHLVAFEWIDGRHADYRPGSPDIAATAQALADLGACRIPPIPLPTARDRWGYYCDRDVRHLLDGGGTLLHTDPAEVNVLVDAHARAHLVDWAWPAVGPGWINPALWGLRLVAAGHDFADAAAWASEIPAWAEATPGAVKAFTRAEARRWTDEADRGTYGADSLVDDVLAWADFWV